MPNSADIIPLSKQDVLSIPDTRCIFCENPDELDDESYGEAYTEALDMYDWLNKYAPHAFVLVETDAADDRNHFQRLYLIPATAWNEVKADLLPDVADEQEKPCPYGSSITKLIDAFATVPGGFDEHISTCSECSERYPG